MDGKMLDIPHLKRPPAMCCQLLVRSKAVHCDVRSLEHVTAGYFRRGWQFARTRR